jgi:hypothetical protein
MDKEGLDSNQCVAAKQLNIRKLYVIQISIYSAENIAYLSINQAISHIIIYQYFYKMAAIQYFLVPIVQEAGWAPGPIWTGAENFAPTGI